MALSANTVWELRTTGSDNNGGGFVAGASGVDYSQQDAAQFSGTDLVIDGTLNTKVTSASHTFDANDVGNIIQVRAGTNFTVGFYQIVSVASGAATLDRAVGTVGATGGTWAEGGAMGTPGKVAKDCLIWNGNTVWMKAGTYTLTTSTAGAGGPVNGNNSIGWKWYGYDTVRGDNGVATINAGSVSGVYLFVAYPEEPGVCVAHIKNIKLDGNGNSPVYGFTSTGSKPWCARYENCEAYNLTYGFAGSSQHLGCIARNCSNTGFLATRCIKCVAKGCGTGFRADGEASWEWLHCLAYDNTTGFSFATYGRDAIMFHCTSVDNSSHGFVSQGYGSAKFVGCLAAFNGGYGFVLYDAGSPVFNCYAYSNTSGARSNTATYINELTSLTADPFTNRASDDYSLNDVSGGGAALRGVGYAPPLQTDNNDAGALQHEDPAGGGADPVENLVLATAF